MRLAFLLSTLLFTLCAPATAQDTAVFRLSADALEQASAPVVLPTSWTFYPGDAPHFADPDFEHDSGAVVDTRLLPDTPLPDGWQGIGWFRLRVQVDTILTGRPLGIQVTQRGASELYLDGRLLHRFGTPAAGALEHTISPPPPAPLFLNDTHPHVLAVRYSNQTTDALHEVGYEAGFTLHLGPLNDLVTTHAQTLRSATVVQTGLTAIYLVFGLLHLFLFAFYPAIRENLYFSIVAGCIAVILFNNFHEALFYSSPAQLIFIRRLWSPLALLTMLAFLRFIYGIYCERPPRYYYGLIGLSFVLGLWGWLNPNLGWFAPAGGRTYAYAFTLILDAELLRTIFVAHLVQRSGPLIIAFGVLAFVVAFTYPVLVVLGVLMPFIDLLMFSNLVILGLLLSISLYLSHRFAQTNTDLQHKLEEVTRLSAQQLKQERHIREQEVERQRLETEYQQKLKELEEARELQLSMLPKHVPSHPDIEVAAFMQTATEVGGDYYDFNVEDDGTLTVAVGDATGHGMKAGTMVTATKSLFQALGGEKNLLQILHRSTRALKQMNMRQLYMALTLAKFKNGRLHLATAGMPPTLIFRAATGHVEIVRLKGMPLGSFIDFPYRTETLDLNRGDTIILMSDGFPELFNEQGEMLGYDRTVEVFTDVAHRAPQAILDHFIDLGRTWANGRAPDDDMTFVVLKVRDDEPYLNSQ